MPTYFAEGIAPDQMNTIWKNAPLCSFIWYMWEFESFPPYIYGSIRSRQLCSRRERVEKIEQKKPNQTKKKSMQLIHSEHFCK